MANTVRIGTQVTGVGKASSDLDKLRDKFDRLQKTGAKGLVTGAAMGAGIGAFNLLAGAAGKATDFLFVSVKAGIDEEAQIGRLSTALKANAKDWDGNIDAIERRIDANKKMAFSDDEQRDALTKLIPVTGDVNDAFKAQAVAMDLARLKNISLEDAATLLAKAFNGQMRGLKDLGINVKDVTTKTEILGAIEEKAAGQAQTFADTHAGTAKKIGDAWADFSEEVGKNLLGGLDALAESMSFLNWQSQEGARIIRSGQSIHQNFLGIIDDERLSMEAYAAAMADQTRQDKANAAATARLTGLADAFSGRLNTKVTPAIEDLTSRLDGARKAWDLLNGRIKDNDEFANLPDKITVAAGEIKDAQKELHAAIEKGNKVAIAAARIRLRDAQSELATLRREFARLRVEIGKPIPVGDTYHPPGAGPVRRAGGGPTSGVTLVGEKGPEIVDLPNGSYVHSNAESRGMPASLPAAGGGTTNFYVTANLSPTGYSPAQAEQIANAVGPAIATYLRRRGLLVA